MGRSPSITNEQILAAARELFLAEGFSASTAEIARLAGVSEGSIFKRFLTKEKLFFAAMGLPEAASWVKDLEELPGKGDLKENLVMLSIKILDFLREMVPRMVMMQAKGGLPHPPAEAHLNMLSLPESPPKPPIIGDLKAVAAFLEREVELGRIRPCNAEILAYTLLGSLTHYVFVGQMMQVHGQMQTTITAADYVQGLIDNLWQGIAPP